VEAARLGGVCLTQGCIPSKALIELSGRISGIAALSPFLAGGDGNGAPSPPVALERIMAWKDGIVDRLIAGVAKTMTQAGVEVMQGWGTMDDARTCTIRADGIDRRVRARNVVLATGSESASLEPVPFGGLRRGDRRIVGIQAVGSPVSELSGEFVALIEMGAVAEDVQDVVHAHPTLGELLPEVVRRLR